MGDVVKINGDLMEVWDYAFCYIRTGAKGEILGQTELTAALNEGYEPYAVTHWMEMPPGSALTSIQPQPSLVEKHHMRRKHLIRKDSFAPPPPTAPTFA